MAELTEKQNEIERLSEQAVSQALQAELPQLQSQIARQVLEALPTLSSEASPDGSASTAADSGALVRAVATIHAGSTQKEILRALLDAGSAYSERIALFVVKAGAASGWQSRGF